MSTVLIVLAVVVGWLLLSLLLGFVVAGTVRMRDRQHLPADSAPDLRLVRTGFPAAVRRRLKPPGTRAPLESDPDRRDSAS